MRFARFSTLVGLAFLFVAVSAAGVAAQSDDPVVEFIDISGILDDRILRFAIDAISAAAEREGTELVVLQIDSPGVVGSDANLAELIELTESPPLPVVTWIGPAPARAYGGAGLVALAADVSLAAPGSEIGLLSPAVAGDEPDVRTELDGAVSDTADVADVEVSDMTAAPRQVVQLLDGREMRYAGGERRVSTLVRVEDGATVSTIVRSPGWWDGFLRLASTPEAAFFLLVAGLTVAAFEFYAIGPGIAAGVAAVCLFLASYGIAVLPVRWWTVGVTLVSSWFLAWAYQRGGVLVFNVLGLAGLLVAGLTFTDATPQFSPGLPGVLLTVGSAAFFFLLAMPTVARSRFSTQTIGRDHLVGRVGTAASNFGPDGVVEVDGARWRATAHREAGIKRADAVIVTAVEGWFLEVMPPD